MARRPREQARTIPILAADEKELAALSKNLLLSLDLREMKAIQQYYRRLGREPTDCELETIAQTWSEHCVHKTFKARISYRESEDGRVRERRVRLIDEITGVTEKLNRRWCISVFTDNAGVIDFVAGQALAFKVETHNHPSALEPYGGAGTGIGGVIRDILGVGLGARPILNTDVFCFGPLDIRQEEVPPGVLHPRRVFKGVVSGVRDYGNRMGIPTASGAILFDDGYLHNCLVFCGTVGLIPVDRVRKEVREGDAIVLAGGRTGRDGIHGATFSSARLEKDIPTSVVQIGNPIVEKKLLDVLIVARDRNLYRSVTDCGAGGLSSAVGEMAQGLGAEVWLDRVPLKYPALAPWEIWVSEAQERMVFSVPQEKVKALIRLFAEEDVEATVIGRFVRSGRVRLLFGKEEVGTLDLAFLHGGLPKRNLTAVYERRHPQAAVLEGVELRETALHLLRNPSIGSKEAVVRQYDHEVIGQTVLKPMVGDRKSVV